MPPELREDGLDDLLLDPRRRRDFLRDHPRERTELLGAKLLLDEVRRLETLGVLLVAREGVLARYRRAPEVDRGSRRRREAPLDRRLALLEGAEYGHWEVSERLVGERGDAETNAEVERAVHLARLDEDRRWARLEGLEIDERQ